MTPQGRWLIAAVLGLAAPAAYSEIAITGGNGGTLEGGVLWTLSVSTCPGELSFCRTGGSVNILYSVAPGWGGLCSTAPGSDCSSDVSSFVTETGSTGQAAAYFFPTKAGSVAVTATDESTAQFVTFNLTVLPGPPVAITACCGTQTQSAPAGSAFAPLQVQVTDFYGNLVNNQTTSVTFSSSASEPSGNFSGSRTAVVQTGTGVASVPFTADGSAGAYQAAATTVCEYGACSATFNLTNTAALPTQFQLSATASPSSEGSIMASPQGSNASNSGGTYTATYNAGTVVQLTAVPANGFALDHWGGGGVSGSTANPVKVTMSAAEDVTAIFVQVVPTTVTTNPPGLSILLDGQSYTSPQTFSLVQGTQHTISTTTPQNSGNSRYTFSNWSDGGAISHTITVNFTPFTYTANFTGTQTSSPLSLSCGAGSGSPQVGVSYSVQCSASGGTAPYAFSISAGTLPAGWNLAPSGSTVTIGGTASTAGPYSFTLQVADASSPVQTATQALSGTIAAGGSLTVSPASGLTFTAYSGRGNPAPQMLTVTSSGGPAAFSVTNTPSWAMVSPSNGTASGSPLTLTVTALTNSLPAGPQNGTITISPSSGQPVSVSVAATVSAFSISSASSIAEAVAAGATKADSLTVTTADGGAASVNASASTASGGNWLKLASSSVSAPGTLGFTIDATSLNAGPYSGSIALTCGNANPCAAVTVAVSLTVTSGTPVMAITQVLNATQEAATISQNTWIEIKGTNLSQTKRTWQASDFDPKTGLMPVELDGVSVTVNGKPAYVYYISSTQINVLTPIDSALGSVGVQVTNGTGASNVFTVTMLANSLGFFAFNSGQYAAAEHADGSYIGPTTLFPGLSTPVKPGETIVLYANGFGETDPAITPGLAVQQGTLPHNPVITLGGLPMNVINAALVSPGLYQFNVVVPQNAPAGDLELSASYDSFSTQTGVLLTVGQ